MSTTRAPGAVRFAALSSPAFRSFTLAGMLWMMGDNIEHVISYWQIFQKFQSPMLGGYAVISHWAPFLFGGMYWGIIAERYDCRRIFMVAMAMFMAVSVAWGYLFGTDTIEVWHAVVLLTVHGLAGAIFSPASQLILHDLVKSDRLPSAVRLTATSRQLGILLGPAVGGFLLMALGPAWGIAANAVFYLPMIAWSLREPYTGHADIGGPRKIGNVGWGIGMAIDTLREASANRTIFAMIALVGLTSLLVGNAYTAQMPAFAEGFEDAHDHGLVYTALLLAGAFGAILGGLLQEGVAALTPSPRKATVMGLLWTFSILVFAAAPTSPIAIVAQFFGGMLFISYVSMAQSLVQLEAPAASRGRIIGVFSMALNGLKIGSGVTVGFLGAVIGIHWSLALSCLLLLVCMLPLLRYVAAGRKASEPVQVA